MTKKPLSAREMSAPEKILPTFHMEADGRGGSISVLVSGVSGVKSYSQNEILIATKKENVNIAGEHLSISVLELKRVMISGKIDTISFSVNKRSGRHENR